MDTKTMMAMVKFINEAQKNYHMIICARKHENAEGTTVMMQGAPDVLMAIMAQQIASFYKRFKSDIKEGIDIKHICDDLARGAQSVYDDWESGESNVADMSGLMQ